jgi:hypothetical protein
MSEKPCGRLRHDIVASREAIRSIDGEIVSSEVVNNPAGQD